MKTLLRRRWRRLALAVAAVVVAVGIAYFAYWSNPDVQNFDRAMKEGDRLHKEKLERYRKETEDILKKIRGED